VKNEERRGIITAIYICADLKCNKRQQTITRRLITEFGTTLPTSPGLCLCGGGFFISVQKLKSTSLQCQMATRLIWSCSSRSLEPCKENDTQNGRPELPEMVRQRLLLKSFSASKWIWLGFPSV
jgi:hypothetical protein